MASKKQRGSYALYPGDKLRRMFEGWWSAVARIRTFLSTMLHPHINHDKTKDAATD